MVLTCHPVTSLSVCQNEGTRSHVWVWVFKCMYAIHYMVLFLKNTIPFKIKTLNLILHSVSAKYSSQLNKEFLLEPNNEPKKTDSSFVKYRSLTWWQFYDFLW